MKICLKCNQKKDNSMFYKHESRCKPCCIIYARKWADKNRKIQFSNAWYRIRFEHLKSSAKKRNIPFSLTKNEWEIIYNNNKCFYCDDILTEKSIDRVNNNLGYSKENCVMCCLLCNKIKHTTLSSLEIKNQIFSIDKKRKILSYLLNKV